jgi:hypothetical protein
MEHIGTQHNESQHKYSQHKDINHDDIQNSTKMQLSITTLDAEWRYAERGVC